jgi:hypothetical protein
MSAWVLDSEYGWQGESQTDPAFAPVLFCAVNLVTGERRAFWGRDPRLKEFVRRHRSDLFIAYNAAAEIAYLLRLGIEPPSSWFDVMIAFRRHTNEDPVPRFRLIDALAFFGLTHACGADKDDLQKRLGRLGINSDDPAELKLILKYCADDCDATGQLYKRLAAKVPATFMRFASDYIVEMSRMDRHGISIDMGTYNLLLDRREEVVAAVTAKANEVHPVFVGGRLNRQAFFTWCVRNGIGWPLTRSPHTGQKILSLDQRVSERMVPRHPFIGLVYEVNRTITRLNKRSLAVDPSNGRHYAGNIPFAQLGGRTSLKNNLFLCPKWMRHLAVPPSPDHALVSVDYDAEEIAIAAYLILLR